MNSNTQEQDCAICLQKCHHPTQLPCGHIFCFLCVKGVAIQSKRCAMCRAEIPSDYLDHPVLLEKIAEQTERSQEDTSEGYQWYYEGRNGWWKYDERSNIELETAFSDGENGCTLLLAGAVYTIDFQTMIQIRRNDPTRRRKVRRDTPTLPAKGIAGIKSFSTTPLEETKSNSDNNSNELSDTAEVSDVIVIEDDNYDTNESHDSDSSVDIVHIFSTINLSPNLSSELLDPESPSSSQTEFPDDT